MGQTWGSIAKRWHKKSGSILGISEAAHANASKFLLITSAILMEIKLKRTCKPINKIKKRWRHKWRTPMEVKVHLKGLQEACSKLWELEDIYFLFL